MNYQRLNPVFDIPLENLEDKLGFSINGDYDGYRRIIPLREIKKTEGIALFKFEIFNALIKKIPLRSTGKEIIYPYKNANISVFEREPQGMRIGQKFVLKEKLISMMEELSTTNNEGVFRDYIAKSLSKMHPVQVYGRDANGEKAIAFYIPPIIEIHGNDAVLIDGAHRSYICSAAGTPINAVHISGNPKYPITPLPFDPISWQDTKIMDKRPAIESRYKNLRKEFFRDLSAVGIDG